MVVSGWGKTHTARFLANNVSAKKKHSPKKSYIHPKTVRSRVRRSARNTTNQFPFLVPYPILYIVAELEEADTHTKAVD